MLTPLGIHEYNFQVPSEDGKKMFPFRIVDVGGQRSERRKWIQCFHGVNCILFVVASNEWAYTCSEDSEQDRMLDSLSLFRETVAVEAFQGIPIMLFLNKADLLPAKVREVSIRTIFPEFPGPDYDPSTDNVDAVVEATSTFLRDRFLQDVRHPRVVCHNTCAMDNQNVQRIFETVRNSLIDEALLATGF